jgi:hypothetical protein
MIIDHLFEIVEESDERYRCYTIHTPLQIFKHIMTGEELEAVRIYVSPHFQLEMKQIMIERYIHWFTECETVLRNYYENERREKVYMNWFNEIEVYSVDIIFNSDDDYGATIACGDNLLHDHTLIIYFDKEQIESIHLNG